jgi:hypothetical protein
MNNLREYDGKSVLLKFKSRRTTSGVLRSDGEGGFNLKLGILLIPVDPDELQSITLISA